VAKKIADTRQFTADSLDKRRKLRRLMRELAKLDPAEEKQMAEEGLGDASSTIKSE